MKAWCITPTKNILVTVTPLFQLLQQYSCLIRGLGSNLGENSLELPAELSVLLRCFFLCQTIRVSGYLVWHRKTLYQTSTPG